MTLAEFLLARIAEDEALLEEEDRVYGGGGEVWTIEAHDRAATEYESKAFLVTYHMAGMAYVESGADGEVEHAYYRAGLITLRHMAVPYANHPDYQPEWKP